jgi:hypothetical protein
MKRLAAILVVSVSVSALLPGLSHADSVIKASEASALGGLSVLVGSAVVIASPFIIVGEVLDASTTGNRVAVRVKTDAGKQETIELPKEAVAKADLRPGDKLTVKPAKSGAVLAKNDTPIAFMVTPENAKLSHSHELAR